MSCVRPTPLRRRPLSRILGVNAAGGVTLVELLAVLAMLSLVLLAGAVAWRSIRAEAETTSVARLAKSFIIRARMLSVYEGTDHFVVIDPVERTLAIYRDSSAPTQRFDAGDVRVAFEPFPPTSDLALPPGRTVVDPLRGTQLSHAWDLPRPDATAAWGATRLGIVTSASGRILSGESTPQSIVTGAMVFSEGSGATSAVSLRGQTGSVRSFQLLPSGWKEI